MTTIAKQRPSTAGRNEWIGIEELAEEIGVPVRTIYAWRTKGLGPRSATFGRHVRYRRADIETWYAEQTSAGRSA